MSISQIASGVLLAKQAETQTKIAAKIVKMNADSEQAVSTMLDAANQNMKQLVSALPKGIGNQINKLI